MKNKILTLLILLATLASAEIPSLIYFSDQSTGSINALNRDNGQLNSIINQDTVVGESAGYTPASAVAINMKKKEVFWTVRGYSQHSIIRSNLDGTQSKLVYSSSQLDRFQVDPFDIEIDGNTSTLYWISPVAKKIYRSRAPYAVQEIIYEEEDSPLFSTIDREKQFLFFTTNYGNIVKYDLRQDISEVVFESSSHIEDLAVDPKTQKIYFTDLSSGSINSVNYDGTNSQMVISNILEPVSIVLDSKASKLVWVDRAANLLVQANLDGSNRETLYSVDASIMYPVLQGVAIADPLDSDHSLVEDFRIKDDFESSSINASLVGTTYSPGHFMDDIDSGVFEKRRIHIFGQGSDVPTTTVSAIAEDGVMKLSSNGYAEFYLKLSTSKNYFESPYVVEDLTWLYVEFEQPLEKEITVELFTEGEHSFGKSETLYPEENKTLYVLYPSGPASRTSSSFVDNSLNLNVFFNNTAVQIKEYGVIAEREYLNYALDREENEMVISIYENRDLLPGDVAFNLNYTSDLTHPFWEEGEAFLFDKKGWKIRRYPIEERKFYQVHVYKSLR